MPFLVGGGGLSSQASQSLNAQLNIIPKLSRFWQSLGQTGKTIAGTGLGGVNIVSLGSSLSEGCFSTAYEDNWLHQLKVRLQDRFNPPGVLGGFGYMPMVTGVAAGWVTQNLFTRDGTWTLFDVSGGNPGTAARYVASGAASSRARRAFDGTLANAAALRSGVSSFTMLYARSASGVGTIAWDINDTDVMVALGAGSRGTGSFSSVGVLDWGRHLAAGVALNPADLNVFQFAQSGATAVVPEGVIAFNGDETCGIQVHNLANGSDTVNSYQSTYYMANIDNWCTAAGGNDTNCKLFLMEFGTNECGNGASGAITVAAFSTKLAEMVDRAIAQPSKPAVLLLGMPLRGDGGGNQAAVAARYPDYLAAMQAIADARPHCAFLNIWDVLGNEAYTGRLTELGFNKPDLLHYSDKFQYWFASYLFDLLTVV